jgi:hypothetical protein
VNYKCLKVEPNACVQQFSYSYIKTIDPGNNGVIVAFQRCCRNRTISNLVNPDNIGATFFAKIAPMLLGSNSSAVFKKLPPNFLCTNAPLVFDHSAEDKDGDSLRYSLILPYIGADPTDNRPIPAGAPPYNSVPMVSGYGLTNMMNGSVKLQIDASTGLLIVTPSKAGQYAVAVKVQEFRDGVLINEGFRDYQLNVIDCQIGIVANFDAPDNTCEKAIDFKNLSTGNSLRFLWDFGDQNTFNDISSSKDTRWIYDSAGTYLVRLIVFNDGCRDTFSKQVTINPSRYVYAKFDATPRKGCDSLTVFLINSSDSATSFTWDTGDDILHGNNINITKYHYTAPGKYLINLRLMDSNTCNITNDSSIFIEILPSKIHKVDYQLSYKQGCAADGKVNLINVHNTADQFTWEHSDGRVWENVSFPSFSVETKGNHSISLKTKDTGRCAVNDVLVLDYYIDNLVSAKEGITLFNVFSPDDDNFNRCFSIDVANPECISLVYSIFNRWGEKVYEGKGMNDCWDGRDFRSGQEAPEGEYFGVYIFKIQGAEEDYRLSNVVTLMR